MTPEQLNAELVEEYKRLGSQDPIHEEMRKLGVTGAAQLKPEQYGMLLSAVRAR